jgi:mannose-1-phosphate guanylyltransferase
MTLDVRQQTGTQTYEEVETFRVPGSHVRRWGVILAGGDGTRLLPLTRKIAGDDRPKQFCAVLGSETLLQQTQRRISRLVPRERTLLMLTRTHERFYKNQIAGISLSRLLIQPCNQGTAPAILYSLLRLSETDSGGVVAFFPSDHHVANDEAFARHVNSAYIAAAMRPKQVILLGVPPESPDVEYGWIEPCTLMRGRVSSAVCTVSRFWEKPHHALASSLMERGCLWNTFIMVGHIAAFLNLIRQTLPDLVESFESVRSSWLTQPGEAALRGLYSGGNATSFSQDVLSVRPKDLAVLCASGLGWSDLGEPDRVLSVLKRKNVQSQGELKSGDVDNTVLFRKKAAGS